MVEALRKDLDAWLDADGGRLRGDARIYSAEEWADRGEPYGRTSALTLTIDGSPLYMALNHGEPSWDIMEELDAIANRHGYWWELGYAWSVHFYPL